MNTLPKIDDAEPRAFIALFPPTQRKTFLSFLLVTFFLFSIILSSCNNLRVYNTFSTNNLSSINLFDVTTVNRINQAFVDAHTAHNDFDTLRSLGGRFTTKTVAVYSKTDGTGLGTTLSGWSDWSTVNIPFTPVPQQLTPKVMALVSAVSAIYTPLGAGTLDQGTPGHYYASHAEKQALMGAQANLGSDWSTSNYVIGVSRAMCRDCNSWYQALAQYWNQNIVIGAWHDGNNNPYVRIYYPNGNMDMIVRNDYGSSNNAPGLYTIIRYSKDGATSSGGNDEL